MAAQHGRADHARVRAQARDLHARVGERLEQKVAGDALAHGLEQKVARFAMYTLHLLQVPTLQVISDKVLSQLLKMCSRSFFLIITIFISLSIGNR